MARLNEGTALKAKAAALIANFDDYNQETRGALEVKGEERRSKNFRGCLEIVFDEYMDKKGLQKGEGKVFYAQHPPGWEPVREARGE